MSDTQLSNLTRLALYLNGMIDGGLLDVGRAKTSPAIAYFMWHSVKALMEECSPSERADVKGPDAFVRSGRWHKAGQQLGALLSKETRRLTANYEYPHGLAYGDVMFAMVMDVMKAFEAPSLPFDDQWWSRR